jgi:hypothetical protein
MKVQITERKTKKHVSRAAAPLGHYIQSGNCSIAFIYKYESLFYTATISFGEGIKIRETEDHNKELKKFPPKNENKKVLSQERFRNGEQTIPRIRTGRYVMALAGNCEELDSIHFPSGSTSNWRNSKNIEKIDSELLYNEQHMRLESRRNKFNFTASWGTVELK